MKFIPKIFDHIMFSHRIKDGEEKSTILMKNNKKNCDTTVYFGSDVAIFDGSS